MGAKLKSISGRIPWFLLTRVFIFGASWLVLPRWLFFVVALYFYFSPLFEPLKLSIPFSCLLVAAFLVPRGLHAAFALSIVFFLILGIKDYFFIHRSAAYEILIFCLFLGLFFGISVHLEEQPRIFSFLFLGGTMIAYGLLTKNFLAYSQSAFPSGHENMLVGIISLLLWQVGWAVLILPLSVFSEAAFLFLFASLLVQWAYDYAHKSLHARKIILQAVIIVAFTVLVFAATEWNL